MVRWVVIDPSWGGPIELFLVPANDDNNDNDDNNNNFSVCCFYSVPSQPPQGVQASTLGSQSIRVAWSPPPLYTLHGILQGYKILYKPVRLDEGKYYNVIMGYYRGTRYSTNLYGWMKVNIIMLSWILQGYKILYKPVRLDEGKYYNVIMEYYRGTRYSTNLYGWMKVNIIMLWNTTGVQDTLQGYKILYKPVQLDEGKYYNVIMEYYRGTRYSTNLYDWMKVNIIMLSQGYITVNKMC